MTSKARSSPIADSSTIFRYAPAMIDQTIAHHKITAKLGEGGMGEVYRVMGTETAGACG